MNRYRAAFGEPTVEVPLRLLRVDGSVVEGAVRVGKPYPEADGSCWRCPVELEGHRGRYPDITGVDSLQALCLALALLRSELQDLETRGIRVLDAESDEPWDLDAVFGRR